MDIRQQTGKRVERFVLSSSIIVPTTAMPLRSCGRCAPRTRRRSAIAAVTTSRWPRPVGLRAARQQDTPCSAPEDARPQTRASAIALPLERCAPVEQDLDVHELSQ
jgi:hypothetical protein